MPTALTWDSVFLRTLWPLNDIFTLFDVKKPSTKGTFTLFLTLFWSILIIFSIFNEKRWKRSKSGFSGFPFFSVFLQSQGISGGEKVVFSVSWGVPHGSEKVMFLTTRNNQKINEKSIFIKMIKNQWKIIKKWSKINQKSMKRWPKMIKNEVPATNTKSDSVFIKVSKNGVEPPIWERWSANRVLQQPWVRVHPTQKKNRHFFCVFGHEFGLQWCEKEVKNHDLCFFLYFFFLKRIDKNQTHWNSFFRMIQFLIVCLLAKLTYWNESIK